MELKKELEKEASTVCWVRYDLVLLLGLNVLCMAETLVSYYHDLASRFSTSTHPKT